MLSAFLKIIEVTLECCMQQLGHHNLCGVSVAVAMDFHMLEKIHGEKHG
jgi:hypothetical protein